MTPLVVICTLPDSRASLLAPPLMTVSQEALRSGTPASLACFSISMPCSISSIGANSNPGCFVIFSSLTSACAVVAKSPSASATTNPYLQSMHDLPE